jgi:putative nucleotidyltransferase with HDIG domain
VRGLGHAKRALEIAAAGGHNLLLSGPPGTGKSMLARRLPGILPPLDESEAVEVTKVHSAAGLLAADSGLVHEPPFRAPHHTVSPAGLLGGGSPPRPGEASLAHRGVLFLDELLEFDRCALEGLRQPLEEGRIVLSRAHYTVAYPTRFLLAAATNPWRFVARKSGTGTLITSRTRGFAWARASLAFDAARIPAVATAEPLRKARRSRRVQRSGLFGPGQRFGIASLLPVADRRRPHDRGFRASRPALRAGPGMRYRRAGPDGPGGVPTMSQVSRDDAWELLNEYTGSKSLVTHMLAVEAAMRAYARKLGEDEELWGVTGLLHDFDYERWPNPGLDETGHPFPGVQILREKGYPEEVCEAILGHAEYSGVARATPLAKTLFAVDELCGFLVAAALVRPTKLEGMKPKSVRKKLKDKSFAAAVNRGDIRKGIEELGVEESEHIAFCIEALREAIGDRI